MEALGKLVKALPTGMIHGRAYVIRRAIIEAAERLDAHLTSDTVTTT